MDASTASTTLTDSERVEVAEARKIAGLGYRDVCAYTGDEDTAMAVAVAFGRAQWELRALLRIVERLAGE